MNNTVDSSTLIEYFVDGPSVTFLAPAIENVATSAVPSLSLHEVFKKTLENQDKGLVLRTVAQMKQGCIRDLDEEVALNATRPSQPLNLPMVESIVLATAQASNARPWTQDDMVRGMEGVYRPLVKL